MRIRAVLFSLFNALAMLALALFWISLPRTFGDEAFFIKWTSLVKKTVLGIDPKPAAEEFLYVDVSRIKSTVPVVDPLFEDYTGYNNVAITDRALLAEFLNAVGRYGEEVPVVIFDVFFQERTDADPLLQAAIDSFPFPLVGATNEDGFLHPDSAHIRMPTGVAMYLSIDQNFMKYPLFFHDSLPTLPLVALYASDSIAYDPEGWGTYLHGRRSLSNPIIDFKVRPHDFDVDNRYSIYDMGSLLFQFNFWEEQDIRDLLRGRTIIVGDFDNDEHETVFGTVPGPMIVHNAYLTLRQQETLIRIRWVLLLLTLFFWMSWRVWHEEKAGSRSWLWARSKTALGKVFADSIDDTFFLVLGTILSYLFFNIHINILILLIYLKIVAWVLRRFVFRHRTEEE